MSWNDAETIWVCPVCGDGLQLEGCTYRCVNRHSYDRSSKGYVNLLLANQRKSKDPGDSKAMLTARRSVLQAAGFRRLAEALAVITADYASELLGAGGEAHAASAPREGGAATGDGRGPFALLDAGCGEGAYLLAAGAELRQRGLPADLYGIDISKDAAALAAAGSRAFPAGAAQRVQIAVASSRHLPVRSCAVDQILQVFAPHSDTEFSRALRPGGRLVTVIPGRSHLYGLKEQLYDKPYYNDEAEHPYPSFDQVERWRLEDKLTLTRPEDIRDLVMMTPYYWKTDPAKLERLMELPELTTPLEFVVTVYRKR